MKIAASYHSNGCLKNATIVFFYFSNYMVGGKGFERLKKWDYNYLKPVSQYNNYLEFSAHIYINGYFVGKADFKVGI